MGRINSGNGSQPIGRAGLIAFVDELNDRRKYIGMRSRYRTVERGGILHMEEYTPYRSGGGSNGRTNND